MDNSIRLEQIIIDLKLAIDQFDSSFKNARDLILELARILDESGRFERRSISQKIKEILSDKIQEGKVTPKWVHDCLPGEYKREYKREVTSLSASNSKKNIYSDSKSTTGKANQNIILANLRNQETSCEIDRPRCMELENALLNASLPVYADKLQNEDKVYRIPI